MLHCQVPPQRQENREKNMAGGLCTLQAHSPPARPQALVKHFDGVDLAIAVVVEFYFVPQQRKGVNAVHFSQLTLTEIEVFSGLTLPVLRDNIIHDINCIAFDLFTSSCSEVLFANSNDFHN